MTGATAQRLEAVCGALARGADGIWSAAVCEAGQRAELAMRERVAAASHDDYIRDIARHHSVPVMDHEVDRFLGHVPPDSTIIDVGGCWGWHWRRLAAARPDVCVVITDFVRGNLHHASRVLGPLVGTQVALVHGDATALPFPSGAFDAYWTVQTLQHIPDFRLACREAFRVMRRGPFVNYSLYGAPLVKLVYRLFGRRLHVEGHVGDAFYLARASESQRRIIAEIFDSDVTSRYSECLFHPDLKVTFTGIERSRLGRLDARLGDWPAIAKCVARQCSFEAWKAS